MSSVAMYSGQNALENIQNLIFNDNSRRFRRLQPKDRKKKFARFVNKVLILFNEQCINKFELEINEYCEWYDVTTWIVAAVAKKVKVLQFRFNTRVENLCYKLPGCLFTCKTLKVLDLHGYMCLNIPNLISLPNLKTLHLNSVIYKCDESVRNLISGCSSLENLYIKRCHFDNVVTFTISSPTLYSLTLRFHRNFFPVELDYKLQIYAPQLRYLDLFDNLSRDFHVEGLCSLHEAIVDISSDSVNYDCYSTTVARLVQGVITVKILSLKGNIFKCLSHAEAYPSFPRLTELSVDVEAAYPLWNSLFNFIYGMDKLKCLTISKVVMQSFNERRTPAIHWNNPENVPICFSLGLKLISITGLEDLQEEVEMVAYILENAKVLSMFTIKSADFLDIEAKYQLLWKIARFSRGSVECRVKFS